MISSVIVVLVLIFTPQVVRLFASGFDGETMNLAVTFTRISVFGIFFTAVIYILNAFLQLKNNFIIPALISLPMNFVLIFFYFIASQNNDILLAYGLFFSIFIQFVFILPSVIKNRFKYYALVDFKNTYVKEMLLLAIPVVIGTSVNQLNVLVDKNIASTIVVGGISALNYADRLSGFVYGLFVVPVVTVIYPSISKLALEDNLKGLKSVVNQSLVSMSILILPASVGAMVLARPIVEFLFMRGEFDAQAAILTSQALLFYAISMLAYGFRDILSRVFYSYNDTKTPTINAIIGVTINIILNIILSRFLGIGGLALATSISAIITAGLLFRSLSKKKLALGFKNSLKKIVKIFIAALIMGGAAYVIFSTLSIRTSNTVALFASIASAGILYVGIIWSLKIEEVEKILDLAREKLQRKN